MSWSPSVEDRDKLGVQRWIELATQPTHTNENGEGVLVGPDLRIGAKVRRGRDWDKAFQPDDQDGGFGSEGELIGVSTFEPTFVMVKWDSNGQTHTYRAKPDCMQLEYVQPSAEWEAQHK
ncbi:hypothetical protein KIPB_009723 [Kipferlia bialata]|uniref:MIB/HERC2 domain-containing protein n=1 Tax=Kipferlia bialata TaxID=797122 RepID=A0A9K3GL06_9EUKA|nr:hypothetical protein KIPB_009723 [Kipferlia bialata]|eukprot:g9723.t1